MKDAPYATDANIKKPVLPGWIVNRGAHPTAESASFASGSALALLHVALHDPGTNVPIELLRDRLALRAAAQCLKLQGRGETEAEIRDAYHLTQPGDPMGPAGDMLAFWKSGTRQRVKGGELISRTASVLPPHMFEDVEAAVIDANNDHEPSPVSRTARVLAEVIAAHPGREAECLFVADALLANLLGWEKPLPHLALTLKRPAIRALLNDGNGSAFEIACHNATVAAAQAALRLAHNLARRAQALRTIAPKLRAKGADDAVALFLSEDAIFPSTMLTPTVKATRTRMSEQAARRLCGRLINLGVVRELTGRPTFRLYGV